MRDRPGAPALLALARDVLVNDLLPLLPPERRLDARLVANCLAIAEREGGADAGAAQAIWRDLEMFYPNATLTDTAPSRTAGEGADPRTEVRAEAGGGAAELLRRFAHDLRIGDFDNSPERAAQARAILWRLTIAKLRLANPRFLSANGFS
jgi:hypothetical protein